MESSAVLERPGGRRRPVDPGRGRADRSLVYFDASAFVKLLLEEPGTDLAVQLWVGCDGPLSSRLSYPEVRAALASAERNRMLTKHDLDAAERAWDDYWAAVRPVELTAEVE